MSSTTCSPPHDDGHLHHQQRRRSPSPPALDLLDEYWFFSNTLQAKPPPLPRSSPAPNSITSISTTANKQQDRGRDKQKQGSGGRRSCRLLLRTPSLPSPHVANHHQIQQQDDDEVQVEDDDLNWSSIYEGVLRATKAEASASASRRSSALRRAPSMPVVPSSSSDNKYSSSSSSSCREEPEQRRRRRELHHHHQQQQQLLARSRSSASDLESMEVQGFRDLGFVFDEEELRESLAAVLPGLKLNKTTAGDTTTASSSRSKPYLSEAWQLVRVQQQSSSIKDQLRMWAQAVASNVRQDC